MNPLLAEHIAISSPLSAVMLADIHRSSTRRLDFPEVQEHVEWLRAREQLINRTKQREH